MKTRIGNLLRGTAQTLLVVGGLSIPPTAKTQTVPSPSLEKPTALARSTDEAGSLLQGTQAPHVLAMRVELAWLADPLTSSCRLEAHPSGGALEVRGQVPSEAVREHALRLARAESGMPVTSKVQLNAALRTPAGNKAQDALHREAFNALRQGFPAQAPSISIRTLADGEIVLKGTVPTYEDKLAISRRLRQATACRCVINELHVPAQPHENPMPSKPRTESATLLAPERLKSQGIQPVVHTQGGSGGPTEPGVREGGPVGPPESAVQALPPSSSASHSPTETKQTGVSPSPAKASGRDAAASSSPKPTAHAEPARAQAAPPSSPPAAKPAAKPTVYQTKWRRLEPNEVPAPKKVTPATPSKESSGEPTQEAPATPSKSRTYLRVIPSSNERDSSSSNNPPPRDVAPLQPKGVLSRESSLPPPVAASPDASGLGRHDVVIPAAQHLPVSGPPAPAKESAVVRKEPYVTDGVVIIETMVKPASHSAPGTEQKPPTIVRTGPYVTSGVIWFSDPESPKALPKDPALADLQTRLQERIATVCGKSKTDVEVTAVSETDITVRIKANSTLEGEEFSNRIFRLPELGPCQVSLDVLVMK